jgi:hypothetical protein
MSTHFFDLLQRVGKAISFGTPQHAAYAQSTSLLTLSIQRYGNASTIKPQGTVLLGGAEPWRIPLR